MNSLIIKQTQQFAHRLRENWRQQIFFFLFGGKGCDAEKEKKSISEKNEKGKNIMKKR